MEKAKGAQREIKIGEPGYVNKNCWLAKNLNYPPKKRCQYCESKFPSCLFFRYLIISLVLVIFIIATSFIIRESISRLVVVSIFLLVIIYGYFFSKSTEDIIVANFAQRKAKESFENLSKTLQQKVNEQTENIRRAYVEDEALLSSIGDGVIATDKKGKVMFINSGAEQMLGIKASDAINKPYESVLKIQNEKGEALPKNKSPLYETLAYGKKVVTDAMGGGGYYYVREDGSRFPAAITVAPVILEGKTIGAVDVFRDVTIERQIDKSKSEFVSLASHQLRTPLTAIKWYSEALLDGDAGKISAKQKKYLKEVYHGNERMIKLIDVMLNISRLEAGRMKTNPTPVGIKDLLKNIIKEQKFDIADKKQKFVFECPDDLPEIVIDASLVRLVFQNIISNSVKYTPKGGKITCRVEKKDNNILVEVADTGIGIPEDQQKRIFEKLFRANNAFPHDPEGNGLGLYAARTTVENLGGKIWFKSKEGKGTTFFVSLTANVM